MGPREESAHHVAVRGGTEITVGQHDDTLSIGRPRDDEVLPPGVVAPLPDGPTAAALLDAPPEAPCELVVDPDLRLEHAVVVSERVNEEPEVVGPGRVQTTGRRLCLCPRRRRLPIAVVVVA